MRQPVIGITTYGRDARGRYTLPSEYVSAVQRGGGLPLLIPPGIESPGGYLRLLDGLILAGGGDIEPKHYAGNLHETLYGIDADRDHLELELARAAIEARHPMLAICRGMQVVNVALGGTLIEHLPDAVGEAVLHRAPPREPVAHPVRLDPASRLAAISGATDLRPMSWHHQAVRTLAAGFEVVARAPDGTIEAAELAGHPELIAVQWHPELTADKDPSQQRLFDALIAAARQYPSSQYR